MADSVGSGFPKNNFNRGHLFFDIDNNTLYMFIGNDTSDPANWIAINTGSSGSGSGSQRWFWKFSGTEFSVGFGVTAEQDFVAPANGTIVQWGIISINAGQDANFSLRYDPFSTDIPIDSVIITSTQTETLFERVVSRAVLLGDIVAVYQTNTFNPAEHDARMCGYIDFTPA